jgi:hypothetical protein
MTGSRGVFLLSWFALMWPVSTYGQSIDFAGSDVVVKLVDRNGNAAGDLSTAEIRLHAEIVVRRSRDHLSDWLRSNGIYPSAESFALYYDLNPDVVTYESVPAGAQMRIPKLSPSARLTDKLAAGYTVRIFADAQSKRRLVEAVGGLKEAQIRFAGSERMAFASGTAKEEVPANLNEIVGRFQDLSSIVVDDQRPVASEMLAQLAGEAVLLTATLKRASATANFTHKDERVVDAIRDDLLTKVSGFTGLRATGETPPRSPDGVVEVSIKPKTNAKIDTLRICYVPEALEGEDDFCVASTGAPKTISLPLAMYKVWAASNEKSAPATAKVEVSVKDSNTSQPVDLLLAP